MWYVNYTISGVRRSVCFYEDEEQAQHFAKLVSGVIYKEASKRLHKKNYADLSAGRGERGKNVTL